MNKYASEMEKSALNALKARQLAYDAGVVVDPGTQWKWALRQFRRGREGNVVQGREKAEVMSRLLGRPAAGPNNFVQAVTAEQRHLGPRDEVQLTRVHGPTVVKGPSVRVDTVHNRITGKWHDLFDQEDLSAISGAYSLIHTKREEPSGALGRFIRRNVSYRIKLPDIPVEGYAPKNYIARNAGAAHTGGNLELVPLGSPRLDTQNDTHVHPGGGRIRNMLASRLGYHGKGYSEVEFRGKGGAHRRASPSGSISPVSVYGTKVNIGDGGDIYAYSGKYRSGYPNSILTGDRQRGPAYMGLNRVVAPDDDTENKITAVRKMRQAYLDLTPRKARGPNPWKKED